jgi:radical SAM superfamily enzyme YgiQ (UPF0313 family)
MLLIYPRWPKLRHQPEFHLPPHGPVCFAATVPEEVNLTFVDEHVQSVPLDADVDLVAFSCMLTCQMPRGWELADHFRSRDIPVIFGGIGTMLHSEETLTHADSVFLGESEGRFAGVLEDLRQRKLRRVYNYLSDFPDATQIGSARRSILNRSLYNYRGIQMVDLAHASRGCRFNCFPCCTPFLGGRKFRARAINKVIAELAGIDNNRIFMVDNSFAQDLAWTKELFRAMIPLKKKWISHPIGEDPELLDLAAEAGCWYVYQAVFDTSDVIRRRIENYQKRGIGVEGTVILGMDDHDEDTIKRLVDFLLDVNLDLAEFTVMTPFPHSPVRAALDKQGRILTNEWLKYTCDRAVFRPARMTPEKLDELYDYAWATFYHHETTEVKMAKLFMRVLEREVRDGTYRPAGKRDRKRTWSHEGR